MTGGDERQKDFEKGGGRRRRRIPDYLLTVATTNSKRTLLAAVFLSWIPATASNIRKRENERCGQRDRGRNGRELVKHAGWSPEHRRKWLLVELVRVFGSGKIENIPSL